MGKKHGPEEVIGKLREAEIVLAQGGTASDACRRIGVRAGSVCLNSFPGFISGASAGFRRPRAAAAG